MVTVVMFEKQKDIIMNKLLESPGSSSHGMLVQNLKKILTSSSAQIEFFTLLGIILNGLMQGYATSNTIYVFLIENLEDKVYRSCGMVPPCQDEG